MIKKKKKENKHVKKKIEFKAKLKSFSQTHTSRQSKACAPRSQSIGLIQAERRDRGNVQICTNTRWQLWITADRHVYL